MEDSCVILLPTLKKTKKQTDTATTTTTYNLSKPRRSGATLVILILKEPGLTK